MNYVEDDIQEAIVEYLRLHNIMVFSVPNELMTQIPNAARRMNRFKKKGLLPGAADLVIVLKNKVLFVEVKSETGKQTTTQKQFNHDIINLGHEYYIVRSLDEMIQILRKQK